MSAVKGVHIVAVWRDGWCGQIVASAGEVFADYSCAWDIPIGVDGEGATYARGLYSVTWRGEDDPPEVERVGDLPDVDALAVMP